MKALTGFSTTYLSILGVGITIISTNIGHSQSVNSIKDHKAKYATIPGHGMSRAEYPFADDGYYMTEWVKWIEPRKQSSTTVRGPISASSSEHSNNLIKAYEGKNNNSFNRNNFSSNTPKQPSYVAQKPTYKQSPARTSSYPSPRNSVAANRHTQSPTQLPHPQLHPQLHAQHTPPATPAPAQISTNGYIGPYNAMIKKISTIVGHTPQGSTASAYSIPASPQHATVRPSNNYQTIAHAQPRPVVAQTRPVVAQQRTYNPVAQQRPTVIQNLQVNYPQQPQIAAQSGFNQKVKYHKVSSGDTLYNISRRYGLSVTEVKRENGLTSDLIRIGQSLRLALAQHALGIPN